VVEQFWEIDGWEQQDRHLSGLKSAPFQRDFAVGGAPFALGPGLWILRGPRQVGKSSWMKTLLSRAPAQQSFYRSCEGLEDHKELQALLDTITPTRSLILLDEVTFVKEWARAIKHTMDRGYRGTLVVTGSHSVDLRRGGDQMPGRFFGGGELQLLPMSFSEYQHARCLAGWPVVDRITELQRYFRCGGFPAAVIEAGPNGGDTPLAKDTYRRWLAGDAAKLGKREAYLRDVLGQLAVTMTSSMSLQTLAKRTQFGSHHTALEYVELLEDCFALRTLYAIDVDTHAYMTKRQKKFYFTDPLLYWLALEWSGFQGTIEPTSALAEMVAAETLLRACAKKNQRIGYVSSAQGEVDFVGATFAVEVKWSQSDSNISRAYKQLLVPDKRLWNQFNLLLEMPLALRT
jgi:uncharacterized protein